MYYRIAAVLAFLGAVAVAWLGAELILAYFDVTSLSAATIRVLALLGAAMVLYLVGLIHLTVVLRRVYAVSGLTRPLLALTGAPVLLIGYLILFGPMTYQHTLYWYIFGLLIALYIVYSMVLAYVGVALSRLRTRAPRGLRLLGRFMAAAGVVYVLHGVLAAIGAALPEVDTLARVAFGVMLVGGFFMMLAELALCIVLWRAPSFRS